MLQSDSSDILESLGSASTKSEVKELINRVGYDKVSEVWKQLSPVQQAALRLINFFEGSVIVHDIDGPINRKPDSL